MHIKAARFHKWMTGRAQSQVPVGHHQARISGLFLLKFLSSTLLLKVYPEAGRVCKKSVRGRSWTEGFHSLCWTVARVTQRFVTECQ